ncbi:MAG: Mannose-1-phosphate guanylyltransferase / Mannose-6-phosphate isomerase, partial [uncultured Frankineae bacterium]
EARPRARRRLGHPPVAAVDGEPPQAARAAAAGPLAARARRRARGGGRPARPGLAGVRRGAARGRRVGGRSAGRPAGRRALRARHARRRRAGLRGDRRARPRRGGRGPDGRPPRRAGRAVRGDAGGGVRAGRGPRRRAGHLRRGARPPRHRLRLPRARRAAAGVGPHGHDVPREARARGGRGVPGGGPVALPVELRHVRLAGCDDPAGRRHLRPVVGAGAARPRSGVRHARLGRARARHLAHPRPAVGRPRRHGARVDVAGLHGRRRAARDPVARRRVLACVRTGAGRRRRRQPDRCGAGGAAGQPRQRRRVVRSRPPGGAGRLRGAGRRAHPGRDARDAGGAGAAGQGPARPGHRGGAGARL